MALLRLYPKHWFPNPVVTYRVAPSTISGTVPSEGIEICSDTMVGSVSTIPIILIQGALPDEGLQLAGSSTLASAQTIKGPLTTSQGIQIASSPTLGGVVGTVAAFAGLVLTPAVDHTLVLTPVS